MHARKCLMFSGTGYFRRNKENNHVCFATNEKNITFVTNKIILVIAIICH